MQSFGDALPKTDKPFLGSQEVVEDIVKGVMGAAQTFASGAMTGVDPESNKRALFGKIDEATADFLGKNDAYEATAWNTDGGLSAHLIQRYSMQGNPDPVQGIVARVALDVVKLYKSWRMDQISDAECEARLQAVRTEAVRDFLGLPDEEGIER